MIPVKKACSFVGEQPELKHLQRIEHRFDFRHLVGSEEIGSSNGCEDRKKRFRAPHFFSEKLERMRQRVANRVSKGPQPECI